MKSASATASLMPSGRSSGPSGCRPRLDRLGLGPRPREYPRASASGCGRVAGRARRRRSRPRRRPCGAAVAAARARLVARPAAPLTAPARPAAQRSAPTRPSSAARSSRAAASGSSASVIARTTTIRVAPRSTTSCTLPASSPPIANHGLPHRARRVRDVVQARPRGGPAWSASRAPGRRRGSRRRGPRPPRRPGRARGWSGRRSGPARQRAGLRRRLVVLADVDAVGAARLDQVGPVVEDEQRVVAAERAAPRSTSAVVVEGLVAQLDQVDAAAHRRRDPRPRRARGRRGTGGRWPGAREASPTRGYHEAQNTGARSRAERAPSGRRPSNLIRVVPA